MDEHVSNCCKAAIKNVQVPGGNFMSICKQCEQECDLIPAEQEPDDTDCGNKDFRVICRQPFCKSCKPKAPRRIEDLGETITPSNIVGVFTGAIQKINEHNVFDRMVPASQLREKPIDLMFVVGWLLSDDTGTSSKALCRHMLGIKGDHCAPSDQGDRGRCIRLLKMVPQWFDRLNEMSMYPDWREQVMLIQGEMNIIKVPLV
ncbi:MAG: hypothetical protein V4478_03250 [Patescibacteria group bacterium]